MCVAIRVQAAQDNALALVKYECIVCPALCHLWSCSCSKVRQSLQTSIVMDQVPHPFTGKPEERSAGVVCHPFTPDSRPLPSLTKELGGVAAGSSHHTGWVTHTPAGEEMCHWFNAGRCRLLLPSTSAGSQGCGGTHPCQLLPSHPTCSHMSSHTITTLSL